MLFGFQSLMMNVRSLEELGRLHDLGVWGFGGEAPIMIAPVGRARAPIYPPNSPRPFIPALRGVGG